ncbi:interferon-inducible GTPase 1 [Mucor ambiguus]|uniref:Interferon-inducible GTPase 1 n=1 Tax=Mucor ambiguus TaxID=91626 RepID=A0A0C9MLH7_9FUNG|nr:interferon-inducible GTPase 1 [Mucor ambiguus]
MGQASSSPSSLGFFKKNPLTNEYEDMSNKFTKATMSTLAVPVIIVAYPVLNAYTFQDSDITGYRIVDGAIGGVLGVIGWPLAPIMAIWGAIQINFKEKPPLPLPVPLEVLQKAQEEINLNISLFYNIAVVGCSGTGKSSIVNAIRGYKDTHPKASKVGEVETTEKPMPFQHPDLASMVIWDMPGVGTQSHQRDTYFQDNYLSCFDLLVIVLGNRLMQDDIDIALQAKEHRIPILFVRSKSDQAIASKTKRHEGDGNYQWATAVGEFVLEVRDSIFTQLRQHQLNTKKLFIVSAESLRMFVATINKQEERKAIKTIDEERFMTSLIEGVVAKRDYYQKQAKLEQKRRKKQEKKRQKDASSVGSNQSNLSAV